MALHLPVIPPRGASALRQRQRLFCVAAPPSLPPPPPPPTPAALRPCATVVAVAARGLGAGLGAGARMEEPLLMAVARARSCWQRRSQACGQPLSLPPTRPVQPPEPPPHYEARIHRTKLPPLVSPRTPQIMRGLSPGILVGAPPKDVKMEELQSLIVTRSVMKHPLQEIRLNSKSENYPAPDRLPRQPMDTAPHKQRKAVRPVPAANGPRRPRRPISPPSTAIAAAAPVAAATPATLAHAAPTAIDPAPHAASPATATPGPHPGLGPSPAARRGLPAETSEEKVEVKAEVVQVEMEVELPAPAPPPPPLRFPGRRPRLSPQQVLREKKLRAVQRGLSSCDWEAVVSAVRTLAALARPGSRCGGGWAGHSRLWPTALDKTEALMGSPHRRVARAAVAAAADLLSVPRLLLKPGGDKIVLQVFSHIARVHFCTFQRAIEAREVFLRAPDARKVAQLLIRISASARTPAVRCAVAECALLLLRRRRPAEGAEWEAALREWALRLTADKDGAVRVRGEALLAALAAPRPTPRSPRFSRPAAAPSAKSPRSFR